MRKNSLFIILVFTLLFADFTFGQIRYGTIDYEVQINIEKRFPTSNTTMRGGRGSYSQNTTPNKYLVETATLYFTDSMSIFIVNPLENPNDQRKTFTTSTQMNLINKTLKTNLNILGDNFEVSDSMPNRTWKLTNKTRTIAGVDCPQAICQIDDSTTIYAWFYTDILPSVGPESYWGLPGAILGLAYEDGSVTYFATKINSDFPDMSTKSVNLTSKKIYSRSSFNQEFATKYKSTERYFQLIQDVLHFF